ncbi:MAG TPA: KEOPS complex subunit Cgi121 [Thermoplasmata archaeon]|nr:KEOPS complex subunit Cgi121 [Thermoplasmata archaeon]
MTPPVPAGESRTLQATGARRKVPGQPDVPTLVRTLRRLGGAGEGLVMLFDARSIAGEAHVLSAWAHLGRARSRGESRLRDRGAELALYVAGDDQLPRALQKVGVSDGTEEFVLVAEKPRVLATILDELGLQVDGTVYPRPASPETLDRLGITQVEREAVPRSAWDGLVLERVALLELGGA